MKITTARGANSVLLAIATMLSLLSRESLAQNGTMGRRELTFANQATARIDFTVGAVSVPSGSPPPIRGTAGVTGTVTGFSTLNPVGACTGTAATCPLGEACRGPCPSSWRICPRYWDDEFVWPVIPRGPWPCLSCPPEWKLDFD